MTCGIVSALSLISQIQLPIIIFMIYGVPCNPVPMASSEVSAAHQPRVVGAGSVCVAHEGLKEGEEPRTGKISWGNIAWRRITDNESVSNSSLLHCRVHTHTVHSLENCKGKLFFSIFKNREFG